MKCSYAQGEKVLANNKCVAWTGGSVNWSGDCKTITWMKSTSFLLRIDEEKKERPFPLIPSSLLTA
jgi:hypothetical protein